eukprot:3570934-Amphidinium_carterae.1
MGCCMVVCFLSQELSKFGHIMQMRHTQMALGLSQLVNEFEACSNRLLLPLKQPGQVSHARSSPKASLAGGTASVPLEQQIAPPPQSPGAETPPASRIYVPRVKGDEGLSPGHTLRLGKNGSDRELSKAGTGDAVLALTSSPSGAPRAQRVLAEGVQIEF